MKKTLFCLFLIQILVFAPFLNTLRNGYLSHKVDGEIYEIIVWYVCIIVVLIQFIVFSCYQYNNDPRDDLGTYSIISNNTSIYSSDGEDSEDEPLIKPEDDNAYTIENV